MHNVVSLNRWDDSAIREMLIDWADHIINCDTKPVFSKKLINYSFKKDFKSEMYELQKMDIDNILNQDCELADLRDRIYYINGKFFDAKRLEDFHLAHTHRIISQACKSIPKGRYAEIGSHVGNSALTAGFSNPNLEIYCYDNPNKGWGGVDSSDIQLKKNLENLTIAQGNKTFAYFGNSRSDEVKNVIRQHAPYDIFLVDGDHWGNHAFQDLELAYSVIKNNRLIIFDDIIHHTYLEETFDNFVKQYQPQKSIKIKELTLNEKNNGYNLRGVGLIIK